MNAKRFMMSGQTSPIFGNLDWTVTPFTDVIQHPSTSRHSDFRPAGKIKINARQIDSVVTPSHARGPSKM